MDKRIRRLEKQVADLEAVQAANEALREEAEEPRATTPARVKRKEDYPSIGGDDE